MTDITADFLRDTADRLAAIEQYVTDNNIIKVWNQTHHDLTRETGTNIFNHWWDSPFADRRVMYDMTLDTDGSLLYSGTDPEGDHHSFAIPADFLDPTTRPQAIDRLRATYLAKAEENRMKAEQAAAAKRAKDEAEFQRLGQRLGRLPA